MSDILLSGDRIIKAHPLNAVAKGSCFAGHTDTALNFLLSMKGEQSQVIIMMHDYKFCERFLITVFVLRQNEQDRRLPLITPPPHSTTPTISTSTHNQMHFYPFLINSIDLSPFSGPIFE